VREWGIGVDEAGRGPVIGPLVVCALAIPKADYAILEEMGVADSKSLSKKKRGEISRLIKIESANRGWKIGLSVCSPERIDMNSIDSNLNILEAELFSEAIKKTVSPKTRGEIFLDACDIDQVRFGKSVMSYLGNEWAEWDVTSEHKLDQSDLLVGASSIIAKDFRDLAISDLTKKLGLDIGSGYPSDPKTRRAVTELVSGNVPHDCLRWSWSTVRDAWITTHNSPVPLRCDVVGNYVQVNLRAWSDSNHK
tara:strand:+ start:423 stop:1175 length:753 start_codon:yes stop_codon:yes gene_type:complete